MDQEKIQEGVRLILEGIGEDPSREGLVGTPDRVARACEEVFAGSDVDVEKALSVTFKSSNDDMVLVKDIPFYSMCEHHLLPFYGKAHVAYIPDGKVAGLSKLARTVEAYARRPQLQEQLTQQVADALMTYLTTKGCMVVLQAEHMCMTMRGVEKPGSQTVTYCLRGQFKEDPELAARVLSMIGL